MSDRNHSRSIVQEILASQKPEIEDMKKSRQPWYKLLLSSTVAVSICLTSEFQRWYKPPDLSVESIQNLKSKTLKPPHLSVGSI